MLKRYSQLVPLIVVLFCVADSPVLSQEPRATPRRTFKIQVEVSAGAEKIENAQVIIDSEEEGVRFSKKTRSNKQGIASLSAVPEGRIHIFVIAKDCVTFGENLNLSQDNQTFRVTLTKSTPAPAPSP